MNVDELTEKARRYCAYRERCTREVEDKLHRLGSDPEQAARVIRTLRSEGFLDDKRFAELFARSKFEHNQWGRIKIRAALLAKNVPEEHISTALASIDGKSYRDTLKALARKKTQELKGRDSSDVSAKTAAHCIRKGYEAELVWDIVKEMGAGSNPQP